MKISIWIEPPLKFRMQISSIIKIISEKYGGYTALNDYKGPHITIYGLDAGGTSFEQIVAAIRSRYKDVQPFEIEIHGIGYFVKPKNNKPNYVIYFRVLKSPQLILLYRLLNSRFRAQKISFSKFTPHITITHEDLSKTQFYDALKELKSLQLDERFTANVIKVSTYDEKSNKKIIEKIELS